MALLYFYNRRQARALTKAEAN